jgi:hypothetical protein
MSSVVLIQLRRDINNEWVIRNPVIENGEITLDTTYKQIKVGDGYSQWNDLPTFDFDYTFNDLFLL